MSQMTPEQLEDHADALELLNSEITASLSRQAGSVVPRWHQHRPLLAPGRRSLRLLLAGESFAGER
jgi:hypothetical protein